MSQSSETLVTLEEAKYYFFNSSDHINIDLQI